MIHFDYRARNKQGNLTSGSMQSESADNIAAKLLSQGLTPISITPQKKTFTFNPKNLLKTELTPKKIKSEDLMIWCRQMATLLKAGVPILRCLEQTSAHSDKSALKKALITISESISGGQTLANALAEHPKVFKPVMVSMVDAGEQSGQLEVAFEQLSAYFDLETQTKRRVKTATRYPIMVIATILIALGVINFMVIPTFTKLYARYDQQLPGITRTLISLSNFCLAYWPWMLLGLILIAGILYRYIKTPTGKLLKDKILLKLPVVGPLVFQINMAKFARSFAMTLKSGVPIVSAIELVSKTLGNTYIQQKMAHLKTGAENGESLAKSAQEVNLLTPIAAQMLKTGEESGALDTMLEHVALFYEEDIDYKLKNLSQAIEPILLIIMGVMVLILALGVFLPLWDMTSFASRGG